MVKAATDTRISDDEALQDSFWGRSGERRRARADHPTARIAPPTPAPRRRSARGPRKQSGKGRTVLVFCLVGVLIAATVAGGWWWRQRTNPSTTVSRTVEGVAPAVVPAVAKVTSPTAVVSHQRSDGRLDLVTVIGTTAAGDKSAVLLVPVGTQLEVPANGIQQLAELNRLGGDPLIELGLENGLGVAAESSAVLDDAAWRSMFDAAGQLLVTLPRAVNITEPALALPAGPQTITPEQATILLTRTPTGVSEIDHLDTVRAVLDAWLEALASGDRATAMVAKVPQAAPFATAARTKATLDTLPVEAIGVGTDERYLISGSEAQTMVSRAFPDAVYTQSARPRIEIRGAGDPEILAASACVVQGGGNIRLTGRAEPADTTSVTYYRDRQRGAAERMQAALGAGSIKQADRDLDLVDMTIVVGKDFNGCQ